jgi:hypothetical protein
MNLGIVRQCGLLGLGAGVGVCVGAGVGMCEGAVVPRSTFVTNKNRKGSYKIGDEKQDRYLSRHTFRYQACMGVSCEWLQTMPG